MLFITYLMVVIMVNFTCQCNVLYRLALRKLTYVNIAISVSNEFRHVETVQLSRRSVLFVTKPYHWLQVLGQGYNIFSLFPTLKMPPSGLIDSIFPQQFLIIGWPLLLLSMERCFTYSYYMFSKIPCQSYILTFLRIFSHIGLELQILILDVCAWVTNQSSSTFSSNLCDSFMVY